MSWPRRADKGHMRRLSLVVLLATWAGTQPAPARAAEAVASPPGGFGALGQIAVSADVRFDIVHLSQGGASRTTVMIRPALDYFLMPSFSVGGFVGFTQSSASFGPLA